MPVERYRPRGGTVEAVQFTGRNVAEIAELLGWDENDDYTGVYETVFIDDGDTELDAHVGDFVLSGTEGVVVLCAGDFADRYELDR